MKRYLNNPTTMKDYKSSYEEYSGDNDNSRNYAGGED